MNCCVLCQTEDESRKRKSEPADTDDATVAADKKFKDDDECDARNTVAEIPNS